jgi:hypothetical protein
MHCKKKRHARLKIFEVFARGVAPRRSCASQRTHREAAHGSSQRIGRW